MKDATQAAVLIGPRRVELRSFDLPSIDTDGALLRVEASGVCGADWMFYSGGWGRPLPPVILGHEVVGRIMDIGDAAAARWNLDVGDRIVVEEAIPCGGCTLCRGGRYQMCDGLHDTAGLRYGLTSTEEGCGLWGGYAEHMYLHPRSVIHPVKASTPTELVPLFIPISNGIRWIQGDGAARIGSRVVILGPGQHGLGCVIGAREAGARQVIMVGTERDQRRLAVAAGLGADAVVVVEEGDPLERIRELTDGEMADVVVNVTAGAPSAVTLAIQATRIGGTIVMAGGSEGHAYDGIPLDDLFMKELTLKGVYGHDHASVATAIRVIEGGRYDLGSLATHSFSIEETEDAIVALSRETGEDPIHISVMSSELSEVS